MFRFLYLILLSSSFLAISSLSAQTAEAYFKEANAKFQEQDFMGAKALYEKSLQLNPNNAKAHHNLGTIFYAFQQYEQALKQYGKAISLSPEDADPYISRGALFLGQRKYETALKDLDKAVDIAPASYAAYGLRGEAKQGLGKTTEACRDWQKALSLGHPQINQKLEQYCSESTNSKTVQDLVKEGNQYLDARNYSLAIESFRLAIIADANYAEAYYGRAVAYYGRQDFEHACADFQEAYRLGYKEAGTMLRDICNQDPEALDEEEEKGKSRKKTKRRK